MVVVSARHISLLFVSSQYHISRRCSHAGELHLPLLRFGILRDRDRVLSPPCALLSFPHSLFLFIFIIIFFSILLPPLFFLLLLFFSSSLTLANVSQPLVHACLRECVRKVRDLGGAGRLSRD